MTPAKDLMDAQIGGLGIHLIRNFTDEVSYRREDDRNILTLVIKDAFP